MARIDDVNLAILRLLQANGRMSLSELATAVGRAESTVRERVLALEMDGFLLGYEARVDWARVGLPSHAFIRAKCDITRVSEVAATLKRMPHVTAAFTLTGAKPIFVMLRVRDMQHLHSILREELARGWLTEIEAEIAMECLVEQRAPSPGAPGPVKDLLTGAAAPAAPTGPMTR